MDDAALYAFATGTALNALVRIAHIAKLAEDHLDAQLAPGMFDCKAQLEVAVGFARRCVFPLLGRDAGDGEGPLGDLIAAARADIGALKPADFDGAAAGVVTHEAGDAQLSQTAEDYLRDFAVPNLWFHISMIYAILRVRGVDVGKADFDGLHAYARGFAFVD